MADFKRPEIILRDLRPMAMFGCFAGVERGSDVIVALVRRVRMVRYSPLLSVVDSS